jgi:hypothetical protein
MYKYMYIHVKIVVMITDIGAEYGRGSARGAFADTGGVDRIEEALQRQRCSVAGPFLMYVIVICFLIVSG